LLSTTSFESQCRATPASPPLQVKAELGPSKQQQATSDHEGVRGERKNNIREKVGRVVKGDTSAPPDRQRPGVTEAEESPKQMQMTAVSRVWLGIVKTALTSSTLLK
jgi:hypothetical protein